MQENMEGREFDPQSNESSDVDENYLKDNDVDEVVGDDYNGQEDTLEIDLRNNSTSYFDQHSDSVYFIASHPTLPLVASGGGDNVLYLWTTNHSPPKLAAKLTDHTESVVAGGFTANGKFLVTGDMSGRMIVWKSNSTGEKWTMLNNSQEVEEIVHISFHPTESFFAVSASDGSVWCYELSDDLTNISVLHGHSLPTTATAFIPGDALQLKLFSVSEDGLLVLWDVYGSRAEYTLGPKELRGNHPWVSVALSPTGRTVAVGSMDGLIVLVKLADGALLNTVDTTKVKIDKPVASSAARITSGAPAQGEEDEEDEEDGRSIEGLAWSDKTNLLATGNVDGNIILWDTQTWRPRSQFQLEDAVTKMEFVPGTRLLVVSSMHGNLLEYDVISSEQVWECLGHNEGVLGFAIQNNGNRLISAGDDHVCLIFDRPN